MPYAVVTDGLQFILVPASRRLRALAGKAVEVFTRSAGSALHRSGRSTAGPWAVRGLVSSRPIAPSRSRHPATFRSL